MNSERVCRLAGRVSLYLFWVALPVVGCEARAATNTVIVPGQLATQDLAFPSWTLQASNVHIHEVYGAEHFPTTGMYITELRFRPDSVYGQAFTTSIANIEIRLSTTVRSPDALSLVFSNNVGWDDVVVQRGPLAISSQFRGPAGGPKEFDIGVPLSRPFLHDPSAGNLLLEIRNFSGSAAAYLSGSGLIADHASRLIGNMTTEAGYAQTVVDALEIVYTPTNAPPSPLRLARGPYLQARGASNVVVRWRARPPSDGRVQFGLGADSLLWQSTDPTITTEHSVSLTNLAPGTRYYYAVGSTGTNIAQGSEFTFVTAPLLAKPTRIWVLGDCGTITQPGEGGQAKVRDAYYAYAGERSTDVWLMLGDNAYDSGLDEEYELAVFDMYARLFPTTALWPAIGNHDAVSGDYFKIFSPPVNGEAGGVASGSPAYYSFNYANIHFICLDSETSTRGRGSPMLTWLAEDLSANTSEWTIAFWHQPPYSKGTHDSDMEPTSIEMRQNAVPILEAHGVDLVLCGHSHGYERSYFLNGHYGASYSLIGAMILDSGSGRPQDSGPYLKAATGPAANQGAVYLVGGSSGWAQAGPLNHPAMFSDPLWNEARGLARLGSVVIDIEGKRLDAAFLRETGSVDDHFTIIKAAAAAPFRLATVQIRNGQICAQWKSVAGRDYQLEMSPSLDGPMWTAISPVLRATGATTQWNGPAGTQGLRTYFRVVEVER